MWVRDEEKGYTTKHTSTNFSIRQIEKAFRFCDVKIFLYVEDECLEMMENTQNKCSPFLSATLEPSSLCPWNFIKNAICKHEGACNQKHLQPLFHVLLIWFLLKIIIANDNSSYESYCYADSVGCRFLNHNFSV